MREGLSQNTVFSITQDRDRNMWFATYEGINRFDGYNFTVYHPERDPDFVQVESADPLLYADSRGRVWAYDGGLSRYDPQEDRFVLMKGRLRGPITSFLELPGVGMLVAVDGEIKVLDIENGDLLDAIDFLPDKNATVMAEGYGLLVVGTLSGDLAIFKADGLEEVARKTILPGRRIFSIVIASENEVWLAAKGGPITRYNIEDGSLRDYSHVSSINPVSSVMGRDRYNRIIVFAKDGFYAYDGLSDRFVFSFSTPEHPITLKSIFRDAEGDIWLGSYYKGVYYCHSGDNPFEPVPISHPSGDLQICCMSESPEGQLLVGTMDKGTWLYDPSTRQVNRLAIAPDPSDRGIKNILFSPDGRRIWFGLDSGLSEYDRKTGEHIIYRGDGYPRAVYSIAPAGDHQLWLGTLSGVYLFDTGQKRARKMETSGNLFIYKLLADDEDNLWVASESGLYRAKVSRDGALDCGTFEKESEAMDVHDVLRSGDRLIVAARNGIFLRDKGGEWSHYDLSVGLSSNFINGVEADHAGVLWIGTEFGLNRFDPSSGDCSRFFKDDGTGIDYYTKNSHCCASDGTVYFGGIGGLTRINPAPRKKSQGSCNPRITDFLVNGIHQSLKDNTLNYKENSVSFRFSVTNYSSRQRDLFCYRLCGVDNGWRTTENPFSDTWVSLRPGKYRFELRSYNSRGEESPDTAVYSFIIRPPWWASNLARIFYVLLGATLLGLVIWRINLVSKRRAQAEIDRITEFTQAGIDRLTVLHYTGEPVSPEDADFILKAVRAMENNLSNENYGVEQLADDLCMSRSNLYIKLKKLTGDSALQFVHKIRLEKACELLRGTQMSITEIAQEAGFGSAAYFCTCFKREKGKTPNQWR